MSVFDFNGADAPRPVGELIPNGTKAMVVMALRPGGQGQGGWLKASRDGACLMLDAEFTIDGGPHNRRKFWGMYVVEVDANATDGQKQAVDISRGHLRAILESARNIMPGDTSEQAMNARRIGGYGDLDGLRFPVVIAVEKGKSKNDGTGDKYDDKNVLGRAITPDDKDYLNPGPQQQRQGGQAATVATTASTQPSGGASTVQKPAWAA